MTPADEWARCRPWLEAALPYCFGTYKIEDIEAAIAVGRMIFLPGKHCALLLEICPYPQMKVLNVFLGGGERGGKTLGEYREHLDEEVVRLAKFFGCERVTHHTRQSGERVGKALGYRKLCSVMSKDV